MFNPKILAMVMAGGEGKRLYPLTRERSKPAVPFGGRYRIVDFVLSNLTNSQIFSIYLLVQYKSQSLIEHIRRSWGLAPIFPEQFVTVVPPQMREGPEWFQGTADAVYQNLNLIRQHALDLVAVFGADHIYRMGVRQMARFHLEHDADVTVAALPVPLAQACDFGVIETGADGRIRQFHEKPACPYPMIRRAPMPRWAIICFARMPCLLHWWKATVAAKRISVTIYCRVCAKPIVSSPMIFRPIACPVCATTRSMPIGAPTTTDPITAVAKQ